MAFWLNLGGGNLEARFMDVGCRAAGAEPGIFLWGAKCDANIFINTTSTHIYIHICTFFLLYIHAFYLISYIYTKKKKKWVPVSSTGKVSDGCIRDLGFNPCLYQKLIGVLV